MAGLVGTWEWETEEDFALDLHAAAEELGLFTASAEVRPTPYDGMDALAGARAAAAALSKEGGYAIAGVASSGDRPELATLDSPLAILDSPRAGEHTIER